jgi:hypothetical protein
MWWGVEIIILVSSYLELPDDGFPEKPKHAARIK